MSLRIYPRVPRWSSCLWTLATGSMTRIAPPCMMPSANQTAIWKLVVSSAPKTSCANFATLPGVGASYPRVPGVRRIFLERVAVHVYFTFDGDRVIVRAVWGARRRRGPRLADEP